MERSFKKILHTLLENYNYKVYSIEESKDINNMFVDELQSSLLVHEQKLKRNHVEQEALKVTNSWDMIEEEQVSTRGRGHMGRGRGRGRALNKYNTKCYRCHKLGHFKWECLRLSHYSRCTELVEEEEILLMSYA